MGNQPSSKEETEVKMIDSNGNINNNIVFQNEAKDVHQQLLMSEKIYLATCVLIMFEIWKMSIYVFHSVKKSWVRRYGKGNNNNNNNNNA